LLVRVFLEIEAVCPAGCIERRVGVPVLGDDGEDGICFNRQIFPLYRREMNFNIFFRRL
jgi:hypothetical protein